MERTRNGRLARRDRAVSMIAGAALVLSGVGGCQRDNRSTKGESIFEAFMPPTPAEAAAWAGDPYDADKRFRGILLLANAPFGGESVYLDMYRLAVNDGDPLVRSAAVRALAMHGLPEDVELFLPLFDDPDQALRWEVARALQRLHNPVAIRPLIEHCDEAEEASVDVRASSASALAQYPQREVFDALVNALADRELLVNEAARASLATLTGQNFGYEIRGWVDWSRASANLFAGQQPYVYPVFHRDEKLIELLTPWWNAPNEIASTPVGMPAVGSNAGSTGAATEDGR